MDPESILNLFDSMWFHLGILENPPKISISPIPYRQIQSDERVSRQISFLARSKSDELSSFTTQQSSSPDSVLKPHLQTILSDREISSEDPKSRPQVKKPVIRRFDVIRKKRLSKSLSELEFEEVKGFTDLGFVFSEEDKDDSTLVEIIPGLQKLRQKTESFDGDHQKEQNRRFEEASGMRARPYLSEAWEFYERKQKEEKMLMKWRAPLPLPLPPAAASNEISMKDCLKSWAHTVASAVR